MYYHYFWGSVQNMLLMITAQKKLTVCKNGQNLQYHGQVYRARCTSLADTTSMAKSLANLV